MDSGSTSNWIKLAKQVFGKTHLVLTKDIGAHIEEIPIILRKGPHVRVESFDVWPISPDVGEMGTGNDRYLARLRFRYWLRTYVLLATHTNAAVQHVIGRPGHPPTYEIFSNERWHVSIAAWDFIEEKAGEAIMDTKVSGVFLQGDFNIMPEGEGRTNPHSPHNVTKRLGMKYHNERVTWLCWWGMHPVQAITEFPPGHNGWPSDHAALLGRFKRTTKGFQRKVTKLKK